MASSVCIGRGSVCRADSRSRAGHPHWARLRGAAVDRHLPLSNSLQEGGDGLFVLGKVERGTSLIVPAFVRLDGGERVHRFLELSGSIKRDAQKTARWSPDMVSDPIEESLLKLIAEKKKALKPKKATKGKKSEVAEPKSNVINIMDALRKSVANELKSRKSG